MDTDNTADLAARIEGAPIVVAFLEAMLRRQQKASAHDILGFAADLEQRLARDVVHARADAERLDAEAERWSARYTRKCGEAARLAQCCLAMCDALSGWVDRFADHDDVGCGGEGYQSNEFLAFLEHSRQLVARARSDAGAEAEPISGEAAIAALRELELHHIAINVTKGRPQEQSKTLRIIRAVIGERNAEQPA